jgi:divalent metal cation (Fe/Co/Zn/Cd) transporter
MDKAEPGLLKEIADLLVANRKDIYLDIHQLRAWRSGNLVHIDFHLILPRDFTLECAHRENKWLEAVIKEHFNGMASVMIHLDPCIDQDCPVCSQSPCVLRISRKHASKPWDLVSMTSEPSPDSGKTEN